MVSPALAENRTIGTIPKSRIEAFKEAVLKPRASVAEPGDFIPYFKVPSTKTVICVLAANGQVKCTTYTSEVCPSALEPQIAGSLPVTLPIDCDGPDGSGECECEFEGQPQT